MSDWIIWKEWQDLKGSAWFEENFPEGCGDQVIHLPAGGSSQKGKTKNLLESLSNRHGTEDVQEKNVATVKLCGGRWSQVPLLSLFSLVVLEDQHCVLSTIMFKLTAYVNYK